MTKRMKNWTDIARNQCSTPVPHLPNLPLLQPHPLHQTHLSPVTPGADPSSLQTRRGREMILSSRPLNLDPQCRAVKQDEVTVTDHRSFKCYLPQERICLTSTSQFLPTGEIQREKKRRRRERVLMMEWLLVFSHPHLPSLPTSTPTHSPITTLLRPLLIIFTLPGCHPPHTWVDTT